LPAADASQDIPLNARSSLIALEDGAIDQDGDRLVLTPNRLQHKGLVVGDTTLTTDSPLFNLKKELGKGRNILYAKLRDGVTQLVTYAKPVSANIVAEVEKYDAQQPITINWEQDYPFWLHNDDGWYLDQGYTLDSGLYLDGNYITRVVTASPHDWGIDNPGTAKIAAGSILVVPRAASSITNFGVTNFTNNVSFQSQNTLTAAQCSYIDFRTKTVTLNDADAFDDFTLSGDRQVPWMVLELGSNSMRITGSIAGTVDVFWLYKRHYL